MAIAIDLTGRTLGKWTVLHRVPVAYGTRREAGWLCRCECGNERAILSSRLRSGQSQSCHCARRGIPNDSARRVGTAARAVYRDNYKTAAKSRGLAFNLTFEDFMELASGNCFYCGVSPTHARKIRSGEVFLFNGIDRVENDKGYTRANCVTCCRPCNVAKNAGTAADYIERCKQVALRHA